MRLAIVGAGVSGLVCAHLLSDRHDVTVFEANDYAGGHTNTVRVDTADETHRVDTGFIRPQRPHLSELRAAPEPARRGDAALGHELLGLGRRRLRVQRRRRERPVRATLAPPEALVPPDDPRPHALQPRGAGARGPQRKRTSLGDFSGDGGYSDDFVRRLIVPQASAVWSADPRSMWSFPASMLAEFSANHGMFGLSGRPNWLTVTGGSDRYVEAITRQLGERLRISTPVRRVERHDEHVEITPAGGQPERSTR